MKEKTIRSRGEEFELDVLNYIQSQCEDNESVSPFKYDMDRPGNFTADALLESGCKKLSLQRNTIIEIKYRILPDTFSRWVEKIRRSFSDDDPWSFLMIYKADIDLNLGKLGIAGYDISIINFKSLKERAERSASPSDDTTLKESDVVKKFSSRPRPTQDEIIDSLKKEIQNKNISLFLGAGVSVSGGLPGWNKLLSNFAQELNPENSPSIMSAANVHKLQNASFNSAIILARYLRVGKDYPSNPLDPSLNNFFKILHTALFQSISNYSERDLIKSIVGLITQGFVKAVITYNFDDYLETVLENRGYRFQSINNGERLSAGNFPIYHVHGFLPLNNKSLHIPNPVFTEESYHSLYRDAYQWSNVEQLHALNNTTCVFIGLSMSDPNLRRLMEISMMRNETDGKFAPHYVFLRKTKFWEDPQSSNNSSSQTEDNENMEIIENILKELGANVIWYDIHSDLPGLLDSLSISGQWANLRI